MIPLPAYTAHNIVLDDGRQTFPGGQLITDDVVCRAALTTLREVFPVPPGEVRVADLGALEGGYAVALARAGYQVTAIEVRERNMVRCRYAARHTDLPSLEFIQDDARNLPAHGEFDAVFCSGLLYHLDEPVKFLGILGSVTRRLLILKTHYSMHPETMHEGKAGHWYAETPVEEAPWASWGNHQSFWLAYPHLLDAVTEAGFPDVTVHPDVAREAGQKWVFLTARKP